jgi:hypothetical protein
VFAHEDSGRRREIALLVRNEINELKAINDFSGRTFQEEFPLFDHADVIGKAFEIAQTVRRNQHGAFLILDRPQQFGKDLLL